MSGGRRGRQARADKSYGLRLVIRATIGLTLVDTACCIVYLQFISQLPLQAVSTGILCDNIPGLIGKQRRMCRRNSDVMLSIGEGARKGIKECQYQFRNNRWNCSTLDRDASVFGKVMLKVGSREAAFVYAISSAGAVHSITRACSQGKLANCACDPTKKGKHRDSVGEFDWGGCSDNINYGKNFARAFIDAKERKERDARAQMNLHNNRAGRRAVKKFSSLHCKCYGVSGSCAMRTCWLAMNDFRQVGNYIKTKYNGATQVMMSQEGEGLVVANKNHKKPTRSDLVYFDESPDYCYKNLDIGSLGTAGRICNKTSLGIDGCDIMCCGRGYDTVTLQKTDKCDCKFQWCCVVHCKNCTRTVEVHKCKGLDLIPELPYSYSYKKQRSRKRS